MTTAPVTFRRYRDEDQDAVWSVFAATTAQLGFTNGPWDDDMRSIPHTITMAGRWLLDDFQHPHQYQTLLDSAHPTEAVRGRPRVS
jgi:hypothetical protein